MRRANRFSSATGRDASSTFSETTPDKLYDQKAVATSWPAVQEETETLKNYLGI